MVPRDGEDETRKGIGEPCCTSPAGTSTVPASIGAPGSRSPELTYTAARTEMFLTLDGYQNGAPGSASVSANVFRDGGSTPATGTVNVNFQKLVGGEWTTRSTAQRTLVNGHYEVLKWRRRSGNYSYPESNYHEFSIRLVATNAFITQRKLLRG
jgi:hypothetical protein